MIFLAFYLMVSIVLGSFCFKSTETDPHRERNVCVCVSVSDLFDKFVHERSETGGRLRFLFEF